MKKIFLLVALVVMFVIFAFSYKPKNIIKESIAIEAQYNYSNPGLTIETIGYTEENSKPIKVAKCQGCHWKCEQ